MATTTWIDEALNVLAYEFPSSNKAESDEKIKKILKRKKLGPYDAEKVALLRALKDDLQNEMRLGETSAYFTGRTHKYVDLKDFDIPRLIRDMGKKHPLLTPKRLESFVQFCIFIYYMK